MKLGQATIKDIARELNVSSSTVSRALKDYPGISFETKKKVKDLAEKLNYRPNAIALSLRKSKSFTIGVIIPEVVHFFFSTVISGIEEVAFKNGYNVILCQTNEKLEREINCVETMLSNQIDGLLVSYSKETTDFSHFINLIDMEIPVVFFDRIPNIKNAVNVTVNDFSGGYQATKHLIDQGYRRIAHLAGPSNLAISKKRKEGYLAALSDSGISIDENLIVECPSANEKESFEICLRLFKDPINRPDAIFAHHDIVAAGAMMAIKSLGLRIPEDIGVVGFSNWQFASMIDPPLTSVLQPGIQIGEKATKILLEMIQNKDINHQEISNVVLDTELLIRKSSVKNY
ncbi:LacI family DNA-binding transcriptional regulator [Cecembia calidifontis]|jgi:LacI family transcriptional regulator|uniref:LacI family transcriptional regulator n=1 Tax=Cecembia calidifontis TaxID=1187080 RepID=A0A4Q7PAS5_9BACT|nr:LacI family DNA-binding transcriptional regulator [Cecembia calidifontis]RZS97321.1 LacI family transcriptional regulator [Cecembia calidifontis]